MKAAETKTTATTSQTLQAKGEEQQPFFQAERAGGAFESGSPAFFSAGSGDAVQPKPFFNKPFIQTKLTIGRPGDKYEQEADAMANEVVQRLAVSGEQSAVGSERLAVSGEQEEGGGRVQKKCAACEAGSAFAKASADKEENIQMKAIFESNEEPAQQKLQRKCAACEAKDIQPSRIQRMGAEEEEPGLQAQSEIPDMQASPDLESRLNASRGGGSPLHDDTRSSMESAFGTDFSGVRVHTNSGAVQMNQELGAQAFTHGSDIYFNSGKYSPGSTEGQRLLGHELTHVVQQGGNKVLSRQLSISSSLIQRALAAIDINAIAQEVRAAAAGWGTDEERIFVNLQRLNKDPSNISSLKTTYQNNYGIGLEQEIRDEMSGSELRLALELIGINDKPAQGNLANATAPTTPAEFTDAATRLKNAIEGLGTDEETIYAVLIPFRREVTKLNQLKTTYKTLTGRELQADIEGDMSAEELHYALYLLNGRPDETGVTNAGVTGGASIHTGTVPGGTINVGTGVNLPGTAFNNLFSMGFQGGITQDTRWLQFIWREIKVTAADGTTRALNDSITTSGGTYNLTTDPSSPNYNTDSNDATNPFYEGGFLNTRTADSTTIHDMPSAAMAFVQREFNNGATRVVSRAHFNTFLVRDYRTLYKVSLTVAWTFNSAAEPPRIHTLNSAGAVNRLPSDMRARLIQQYPTYSYIQ